MVLQQRHRPGPQDQGLSEPHNCLRAGHLEKSEAQKQASWLSLWSRWWQEADPGHRPLTCRLSTGALKEAVPKIVGGPRNVTNRTQGHPSSRAEDSEGRVPVTSGTSAGKRRVPADGRRQTQRPKMNTTQDAEFIGRTSREPSWSRSNLHKDSVVERKEMRSYSMLKRHKNQISSTTAKIHKVQPDSELFRHNVVQASSPVSGIQGVLKMSVGCTHA